MSALLNFKYGEYSKLPQSKTSGTIYVTTDEQAMYIDLPNKDVPTQIDRVRIGDIIVKDSVRSATPPFANGAFYYFIQENALLRWDGTDWVQINSVKAIDDKITLVSDKLTAEINRSTAKDNAHDSAISDLEDAVAARLTTSDFIAFQTENTAAIADAKKAGTDAQTLATEAKTAAKNADDKAVAAQQAANNRIHKDGTVAMEADLNLNTHKVINVATPSDNTDAANKKYVDDAENRATVAAGNAADAAQAAQGTANEAKAAAKTADDKAVAAQGKADAAYELADSKVTMAQVIAQNYATKAEAQGYANDVLGNTTDASTANTVYGAKKGVAEAKAAASAADAKAVAANELAGQAKAAAATADAKAVTAQETAEAANANAETRVAQTDFDTFVSTNSAAIDAVDKKAKAADDKAVNAQKAADDAQEDATQALADAAAAQKDIDDYSAAHANDYTTAQIDTAVAAAKKAGTDAAAAAKAADDKAVNAQNTADAALPKAGGTMNANAEIKMSNGKITGLAAPGEDDTAATNKKYVDDAIAAGIKANDAMTFKGTVGGDSATVSTLPTTAQKGDTYKVAKAASYSGTFSGTSDKTKAAKIGDLFINIAEDDQSAIWTHISSGYEDTYLQKFHSDSTTNRIYLTDGVTNDSKDSAVSSFGIVGHTNSNLQFAVAKDDANGNHTITASLVWGTF